MKWLKLYSVIVICISILVLVLSFFMMDVLPLLYKFYMGYEIASSKMDKLVAYGLEISNELRLYSLLLLVTFSTVYFLKTVKQFVVIFSAFILIHFVFIAEIGNLIIFRRVYLMLLSLPFLWIFFDFFKFNKETYETKITHGFLYLTLLCFVLPGLYLPPFFSGIQGWTTQIDKSQHFAINGVFLVRKDGEEIRFSRAIVSPINFVTRLNSYMLRSHPQKVNELLRFYKGTYIKRYATLAKGSIPSQNILGKLAYPIHNPQGNFDYSAFPPSNIKEIKISTKYYTWEKNFIKEDVMAREVW
ncbi:MAG: Unknown protein [uncultured Sulfurovum sp.]|uniref:Uncharacterized protein n=1 Tax=uncultured Sulfurovum sp. TaxID=269237 RepID=A0A6S6TR55_9BACT|nr:MAG: Unknown protein [uncultured Sulfurovum sp.]